MNQTIDLSKRIADLSPEKRALFELRLEKKSIDAPTQDDRAMPPIRPIERDGVLLLSFAQQRLWFLDQLEPGNPAYNLPTVYRLTGPLNVAALGQSLNEIARRHQGLRATFAARDGQPVLAIAPASDLALPVVDLRRLPKADRETEAQRLVADEAWRPFDLTRGPLWRSVLLRLDDEIYVLLLTMHHIVSDGWSIGVLNRELAALCEAFSAGKPSPLPELPIQYADLAHWQRQWLQGHVLETQLRYWQRQLGGNLPVLELPTDRLHRSARASWAAQQSMALPAALTQELKALSHRQGSTLFMTLLAAFKTLLHRYTDQEDIIVGSPIAGRNRPEIEGLIGLVLNTLVLRTDLAGNPTFCELLGRVREVTLEAYVHQDLPFEKLVEELQPARDLSRPPFFDVMVNFVNVPRIDLELPGIACSVQVLPESASKFSMTLYAEERGDELALQLVYQRALYSAGRMACLLDQLRYLLEQIVAAPERPIRSYSLVTPESRLLLPDPGAILPEPLQEPITKRFASWANDAPEHTALCHGDRAWTYSALAQSAQSLAQALLAQGLERRDIVAVCGQGSLGLIASMMAVLLSGGVLLTVDCYLPAQRQRLMLQEADAKYLLYVGERPAEDEWLQELASLVIVDVDPETGAAGGPTPLKAMPLPELAPDDAAYLFFTSGTTGTPKGVLGCHKGLSHFLTWQRETFAINPQDRCAQLTALSFDVVLRDIFLPLVSGATLCLPQERDVEPDRVLSWLERAGISALHTVPTLAGTWLSDVPAGVSLPHLRWLFFAGEALPAALVHRWREAFPQQAGEIVNLYGPTETTLAKCFYVVPADTLAGVQPVGRPLPETQALILNEDGRLCGIGEPGEIVLRTPFRSLGYINAPQENQKRFVKNPFSGDDADRLYYTGDRGRYRPDGSLDILGRLDGQIKIRGVRIEPDEVTATLAQHPAVKSCVVAAQTNEQGHAALIAYVVTSQPDRVTSHDLRLYLSKKLPAAMVPSAFVTLDALPLTANGKVDRRALPSPEAVQSQAENVFVAPRTPIEETLAEIWAQVLRLEQVGVYDDFFEIGGHSLVGTQVISRVREAFQVKLPLRALFESPTVAGLAGRIETARRVDRESLPPSVQLPQRNDGLTASPAQERWLLRAQNKSAEVWHSGRFLRLRGPLDVTALARSLGEVVRRHEVLRTTFALVEGRWIRVISPPSPFPLPVIDLREPGNLERESEARRLIIQDTQRPFDRSRDTLLRATCFQLDDEEYVLALVLDHIASDGWSLSVLGQEVSALYQAFTLKAPSPLAELTLQYADVARWEPPWPQGEALEAMLSFLKNQIGSHVPDLMLYADHPQPQVEAYTGAWQERALPPGLSEALKALSQREGVTLFMTLLAAFQTLLHHYTGQDDIIACFPVANRLWPEAEMLIGPFAHGMTLRTDFSDDPSFRELLRRVRSALLEAHACQGLSPQLLKEELRARFGPGVVTGFDELIAQSRRIFFALEGSGKTLLELPDVAVHRFELDREISLGGMALYMMDGAEGLTASLNYRLDLFEVATIGHMLEHLQTLLEGIVADPERRLSAFLPFWPK